jgi:hypothetical protein
MAFFAAFFAPQTLLNEADIGIRPQLPDQGNHV